jgi:hypothetical protein
MDGDTPDGYPDLAVGDAGATERPDLASDARTLAEVIAVLEDTGYRGQFSTRPEGRLLCLTCRTESDAPAVAVHSLSRTEGASDPDDMLAVAAVTCPVCATPGTVVLGYGPEASEEDAEVLLGLRAPPPAAVTSVG